METLKTLILLILTFSIGVITMVSIPGIPLYFLKLNDIMVLYYLLLLPLSFIGMICGVFIIMSVIEKI